MELSVLIPSFRRPEPLLATIRDILKQEDVEFEVIVVDQNTTWPSELEAARLEVLRDERVQWITGYPPGVVAARNHAAQKAIGEVLLFIDDDVRIEYRGFIKGHLEPYLDPRVAAVTGAELYLGTPQLEQFRVAEFGVIQFGEAWVDRSPLAQVIGFSRSSWRGEVVCSFFTCNASIRRSVFMKVGGFDEGFEGNAYGDDYDLAIRMVEAGHRVVYSPKPWLIHLQLPMGGLRLSDADNGTSEFARAVSPLLFFFRHARKGLVWDLFYRHVLRKTVLRRGNLIPPWNQIPAWIGFLRAIPVAMRRAKRTSP